MVEIVESRFMILMLLILLLLLLMFSFSAVFSVVFSANVCYNGFFSCFCFVFICYKVFLLYCWRVFSFRFLFCCDCFDEFDWVDCGCGASEANVVEANKVNVIDLNLVFNAFIRVIRLLIIFINWLIFFWVEAFCFSVSFSWFRVGIISTNLMKGSIIASIVDTSMSFKEFF